MSPRRLAPAALLLLAACASPTPPWTKAGVSSEQAAADYLACRRWADSQVMPAYEDSGSGNDANPVRGHDRERMKQKVGFLAAECMSVRGYAPAKRQP